MGARHGADRDPVVQLAAEGGLWVGKAMPGGLQEERVVVLHVGGQAGLGVNIQHCSVKLGRCAVHQNSVGARGALATVQVTSCDNDLVPAGKSGGGGVS